MTGKTPQTTVVRTGDTPRDEFPWGSTSWCISGAAGNSGRLTLGRVAIKAGASNPKHRHANCDEILYLLSGELRHHADDVDPVRMVPGDAIVIPAGVAHYAECVGGRDAKMIVVYSDPERQMEIV